MNAYVSSLALALTAILCLTAGERCFAQSGSFQSVTPLAATSATPIPALIPFAGGALTADGEPLCGKYAIAFLIYKEEIGGEALFTESQSVTLDTTGHYKAQLGATLPSGIPIDIFNGGEARWLEIQIAGQPSQPRILLMSVPYAFKAADAATLGGLPPSAYALASGKSAGETSDSARATAITPDAVSNVTTTGGTSGYLPVFTGSATVVDSIVYQSGASIGIGDIPNAGAALDVNGKSIWRGNVNLSRTMNATQTQGANSFPFSFNTMAYSSASGADVSPVFYWQAEAINNNTALPGATMNLLYNKNSGTGTETGLYFNSNGTINFAPGQTFPNGGAGTITGVAAGADLTGGGSSGSVTLNLDTTKVPLLAAGNHFAASQTITGTLSASGVISTSGQLASTVATGTAPLAVASTTVVPNLNASFLGGLASGAFASVSAANTFTATQDFSKVGIGTTTPRSLLELSTAALAALGSVVTLTNTAGGSGAEDALDFNTVAPSTTGTYNPMSRIAAMDALHYSDNLVFQSNTPGAPNNGLRTNMLIESNGQIGIGTPGPGAQFEVDANASLSLDAIYSYGATDVSGGGTAGIDGFGGNSLASNTGGNGGYFEGGYAESTGIGGDGIDAYSGGTAASGGNAGFAGYFGGDVLVTGTLSASAKDFEIDHPLDPANKYLDHASVESSEMVNIYSGNVTTDELGIATVRLPEWFEAENADFRYQLTVVGKFAQAIISQEIAHHEFKISTNSGFTKVSWQVTGVRQDSFAKAHPLIVEREKAPAERGFYAHPELYGQPAEKQTQWARHPEMVRRTRTHLGQTNN